jgi:uroporphyrinogen decarboxylase
MGVNFVPVVYEHAAAFIGKSPWEVSRDTELMYKAHAAAYEYYRHSPVTVGIDIYNLEAEAYGARVENPGGNGIPSIREHPLKTVDTLKDLPLFKPEKDGRLPMLLEAALRLKREYPEADVRVPVSGPFSVAVNLLGIENLVMQAFTRGDVVREALARLGEGQVGFCKAVTEKGLGITFFESAATPPMISPDVFEGVEYPVLKETMDRCSAITGRRTACIMGGDTAPILPVLLKTKPGFLICPAETDQIRFMEQMSSVPTITVRINMNAGIIANGTWEEIQAEADRVLSIAQERPNTLIGPGVLAYTTPPKNVIKLREYVNERIG